MRTYRIGWTPAPAGACLGYDNRPVCDPVVAFAVTTDCDVLVRLEGGAERRVVVERGERLELGGWRPADAPERPRDPRDLAGGGQR